MGHSSYLAVTGMDQAKKMNQHEETSRQLARKFRRAKSISGGCLIPVKRKSQRGIVTTLDGQGDVRDKVEADESKVVQLNLKASLMGVKIYGDKNHFFSRQSSMSSNRRSDKFRAGVAIPCCRGGRPSVDGTEKIHHGISIVASSKMPQEHKRAQNGTHVGENRTHLDRRSATSSSEMFIADSGVLNPSPQVGNNANSSILNAVHFTIDDSSENGCGRVTEKLYELLGQSRLQKCDDDGGLDMTRRKHSSSSVATETDKYSDAASTLDPRISSASSLTFSEILFGYEFSRESPQRSHQPDRKSPQASTKLGSNATWQLNNQLGQYSMSFPATPGYDDTDDDDIILEDDIIFEVPNEIALHCSHDQRHYAELVMVGAKPRPKRERWSSSKRSFNLELEQQFPVKPLSINVNRNRQQRHQSDRLDPGRSVNARAKLDVSHRNITCLSSLNSSFNAGSRRLKGGTISSFRSDRSAWLELESEMDDFVLDSGRLKIDMKYEPEFINRPDLFKPDLEQVDSRTVSNKFQDDGAKMDEEDFPFNSPIASTFVFGDGLRKCSEDAHTSLSSMSRSTRLVVETNFDNEGLDHSDAYRDPDDGSISDTDSSLTTFSLEADSAGLSLDQPALWVSTRSFNYLREVVDHNSGFLDIESRSGRFSIDLRQEKRLGRVDHPPRPGMRRNVRKTDQKPSSRRSLLSPCLVCVACWHQRPQDP